MKAIEVLGMLKNKIKAAKECGTIYVIETSDIEAIDDALKSPYTQYNEFKDTKCDVCGCTPNVIVKTQFGTFCLSHARYV